MMSVLISPFLPSLFLLQDLAIVAEKSVIESMIYPLLTTVWGNEETDTVRVSGLSALITIAPKFTSSENQTKILPIILSAATDKSWRIRLSLAESFDQVSEDSIPDASCYLRSLGETFSDHYFLYRSRVIGRSVSFGA